MLTRNQGRTLSISSDSIFCSLLNWGSGNSINILLQYTNMKVFLTKFTKTRDWSFTGQP